MTTTPGSFCAAPARITPTTFAVGVRTGSSSTVELRGVAALREQLRGLALDHDDRDPGDRPRRR